MSRTVSADLRRRVRSDFRGRCAYCQSAETLVAVTFEVEHIRPVTKGGDTVAENLCLACPMCNRHKSDRASAVDPETGRETPLFHPRHDEWEDHFAWDVGSIRIVGLTPIGRAAVAVLRLNRTLVVEVRELWVRLGLHPPSDAPESQD